MCAKCEVSRILNGAEMSQTHNRSTHQTPVCLFVSPFVSSPFFSQLMVLPLQTHTHARTHECSLPGEILLYREMQSREVSSMCACVCLWKS